MDYYLWSKPQKKPFFYTRSKQKASLAIVGRQKSSPGGTWVQKWRTEHRLDDVTSLFQEAALVWNPHLLCDFNPFSPQWRALQGKAWSLRSVNKVSPTSAATWPAGKTVTLRWDTKMEAGHGSRFRATKFCPKRLTKSLTGFWTTYWRQT